MGPGTGAATASGAAHLAYIAIATAANGGKERDTTGCMVAATLRTGSGRIRLAYGAQYLEGCAAIRTDVFIDRHCSIPISADLLGHIQVFEKAPAAG